MNANIVKQKKANVLIATDDERIFDIAENFAQGSVLMTDPKCVNGTERVYEVAEKINADDGDIFLNVQGDCPLMPSWFIDDLAEAITSDSNAPMATIAVNLSLQEYLETRSHKVKNPASGTFVVFDKNHYALYFSKYILPFCRKNLAESESASESESSSSAATLDTKFYRHIGLYAYRFNALKQYINLPECHIEKAEGLEQLRALYNNIPMKIAISNFRGQKFCSVDSESDLEKVRQIFAENPQLTKLIDD
jgi:3-deoxy-manno-octulosonate cytidylyltransferase (CMP-KDO synthetase)